MSPPYELYHTDHLGSIIAITDQTGAVVERRSYDAWGKRRNQNGTAMSNAFITSEVRHAFTGHEDLGEVGLIHMNGRLYDPAIGRFLSADPTIQYADDMQNYNRYSYINNNPLSATDPSGYGFFKSFFKAAFKFAFNPSIKNGFNLIRSMPGQKFIDNIIMKNPILNSVGQMAATYFTAFCGGCGGVAWSAYYTYQGTGSMSAAFRAAAVTYVTQQAFTFVGHSGYFPSEIDKIIGHAMVGCGSSVASGGSCGSGAMAAGFSKAVSPFVDTIDQGNPGVNLQRAMAAAAVGGTASVLGGGKFANGAITAAFGRMYNDDFSKKEPSIFNLYGLLSAPSNFSTNYQNMRDANTIGADKYFHCMANCQSSKEGFLGLLTAHAISDTREWVDQNIKNDPVAASVADQNANHHGQFHGFTSQNSCRSSCDIFRPSALDGKY